MVTIILNDNTQINAEVNGNNYIVDEVIDEAKLDRTNLVKMTIDGQEYLNMKCQSFMEDEKQHLIFSQMSEQEIENANLRSKIEYLAMMSDIEMGD